MKPLYIFMICKTLMWGFAVGILQQDFHHFAFLDFINQPWFGDVMIAMSILAFCNLKWKNSKIVLLFLLFVLFQMSFVTVGYLTNHPIDAAWARNSVEVFATLVLIRKLRL